VCGFDWDCCKQVILTQYFVVEVLKKKRKTKAEEFWGVFVVGEVSADF